MLKKLRELFAIFAPDLMSIAFVLLPPTLAVVGLIGATHILGLCAFSSEQVAWMQTIVRDCAIALFCLWTGFEARRKWPEY